MKSRRKAGCAVLVAGFVMLLAATLLYSANLAEDRNAGAQAKHLLTALQSALTNNDPQADTHSDLTHRGSLPDGYESSVVSGPQSGAEPTEALPEVSKCIGFIRLPTVGIELPVLSEWSYDHLAIAPCRQFGSPDTRDLVIAAHNYRSHFGRLDKLSPGDTVSFTDLSGTVFLYSVEAVRTVSPTEVGTVKNSGSDLVLYTCNFNGNKRVAVFCSLYVPAETA